MDIISQNSQADSILVALKNYHIDFKCLNVGGTLGMGGFAEVKSATLTVPVGGFAAGSVVAVKQLYPRDDSALVLARELTVWAGLDHRHVLRLIGFCLNRRMDIAWMISTYAPNGSALSYIGDMELWQNARLRVAVDAARGLAYLHSLNPPIRHGDIKPENVLMNGNNEAMLSDFGLATVVQETTSDEVGGSLRYFSPELLNDDDPGRKLSSDIWAFGCLLFEVLSGRRPYDDAEADFAVTLKIALQELPGSKVDMERIQHHREIGDLLLGMWNGDPELRPTITHCIQVLCSALYSFDPEDLNWEMKRDADRHVILPDTAHRKLDISLSLNLEIQRADINCVRFSPDGRLLAATCRNTLHVYDTSDGELVYDYENEMTSDPTLDDLARSLIDQVVFHPDGQILAFASQNGDVRMLDLAAKATMYVADARTRKQTARVWMAFVENGRLLVTVSADAAVRLWDAHLGTRLELPYTFLQDNAEVSSAAIAANGQLIATGSFGGFVHLWDPRSGKLIEQWHGHKWGVESVVLAPDSTRLVSSSGENSTLKVWDLALSLSSPAGPPAPGSIPSSALSGDGNSSGSALALSGHREMITCAVFTSDMRWILTGSADYDFRFWDATTGSTEIIVNGHVAGVRAVDVHSYGGSEGGLVASGGWNGQVRIWRYDCL